jgi:NAD(P)H-dependent FMN reductase
MTRILVITGTTREGRFSERVATWVTGRLAGRGDLEIDLLGLAVLKNAMDHSAGALAPGPGHGLTPPTYRLRSVRWCG